MTPQQQINELREQKGLTVHALGKLAKVAIPHLKPILIGKKGCSVHTLQLLAAALGYEVCLIKKGGGDE